MTLRKTEQRVVRARRRMKNASKGFRLSAAFELKQAVTEALKASASPRVSPPVHHGGGR